MLGIIIPTLNRSDFVIRQLNYYANVKCPYTIYVGDSSSQEHVDKMLKAIDSLKGQINIVYKQYPHLNDSLCIKKLIEISNEKYIAFTGDDDYLVPNSLEKAAQFLEENPSYRTAQGKGILFSLSSNAKLNISSYNLKYAEEGTASQRLLNFMKNYWVPLFSLHRKEEFFEDYERMEDLTDKSFTEIMPNCLSVIRGKSKQLDCLYVARETHAERYFLPKMVNWLASENWNPSYQVFQDTLCNALREEDKISQEDALKIVETAFNHYLARQAKKQELVSPKPKTFPAGLALKTIIKYMISYFPGESKKMRLESLNSSRSPYNKDFLPLKKSIIDSGI